MRGVRRRGRDDRPGRLLSGPHRRHRSHRRVGHQRGRSGQHAPGRRDPAQRPLSRRLPLARVHDAETMLLRGRGGGLRGQHRPHDGYRRHGAGGLRGYAQHFPGRLAAAADQDLPRRPAGGRHLRDHHVKRAHAEGVARRPDGDGWINVSGRAAHRGRGGEAWRGALPPACGPDQRRVGSAHAAGHRPAAGRRIHRRGLPGGRRRDSRPALEDPGHGGDSRRRGDRRLHGIGPAGGRRDQPVIRHHGVGDLCRHLSHDRQRHSRGITALTDPLPSWRRRGRL